MQRYVKTLDIFNGKNVTSFGPGPGQYGNAHSSRRTQGHKPPPSKCCALYSLHGIGLEVKPQIMFPSSTVCLVGVLPYVNATLETYVLRICENVTDWYLGLGSLLKPALTV